MQDDFLRSLRHDVRHSLYVLDLALTLLEDSRHDERRFTEVLQMLRKEREAIGELVDRLLGIASGAARTTDDGLTTIE